MERNEEIKCASKDYVNYLLDKQEYHNEDYTEYDIRQAFEKGAMFADNNPDLSSLWHDAIEEPKEEGYNEVLCINDELFSFTFSTTSFSNWELCRQKFNIKQWAYITDLLPKTE